MLTKRIDWLQIKLNGVEEDQTLFGFLFVIAPQLTPHSPSCITERRTKLAAQLAHGAMEVWVRVQYDYVHVNTTSEVTYGTNGCDSKGKPELYVAGNI